MINFKVDLIGCGGTALTLLEIKESTKDIDFIVPSPNQYQRLMKFLSSLGYKERGGGLVHPEDPAFLYQFWVGNRVFTTELLDSPLDPGKNIPIRKWSHIYLGALNLEDLIITKMFRGTQLDIDDCVAAFAAYKIDPEALLQRYAEAAEYDLNPKRMIENFSRFAEVLLEKTMVSQSFLEEVEGYR